VYTPRQATNCYTGYNVTKRRDDAPRLSKKSTCCCSTVRSPGLRKHSHNRLRLLESAHRFGRQRQLGLLRQAQLGSPVWGPLGPLDCSCAIETRLPCITKFLLEYTSRRGWALCCHRDFRSDRLHITGHRARLDELQNVAFVSQRGNRVWQVASDASGLSTLCSGLRINAFNSRRDPGGPCEPAWKSVTGWEGSLAQVGINCSRDC